MPIRTTNEQLFISIVAHHYIHRHPCALPPTTLPILLPDLISEDTFHERVELRIGVCPLDKPHLTISPVFHLS